jgi:DNA-binding transcriptional ArsR family regulator
MVESSTATLDRVFHALADPTRRAMLGELARGTCSIGELAAPHAMSFAAASKHVKVLESAGLLRRQVRGREHLCELAAQPLGAAYDYLGLYAAFWSSKLDALAAFLDEQVRSPRSQSASTTTTTEPRARRKTTRARRATSRGKPRHDRH